MNDTDDLMTVDEVCAWWRVTKDWVWDAVQQNRIPYMRVGGRKLRFSRAALEEHMKAGEKS